MPRRYRRRKLKYRRRRKKRRRSKMSILKVPGLVMPDTAYVNMKATAVFVGLPLTFFQHWTFHGNDIHNPFGTHSAATPQGLSQWSNFFNKYQVMKSSIRCQFINLTTNEARIMITPTLQSAVLSGDDQVESRYTKNTILGRPQSSHAIKTIRSSMSTKKMFGRTIASVNYTAAVQFSPVALYYWQVQLDGVETPNPPATDLNYSLSVSLFFRVKFWDRAIPVS